MAYRRISPGQPSLSEQQQHTAAVNNGAHYDQNSESGFIAQRRLARQRRHQPARCERQCRSQHCACHSELRQRYQKGAIEYEELAADGEQHNEQQIDPCANGGGQREPDLRQRSNQRDFQRDIDGHTGQRGLDGRRGILAGVESGDGAPDQNKRNKPDRVSCKRRAGGGRIGLRECTPRKHGAHDDVRHDKKSGDERDREQQREIERAPLRSDSSLMIARGNPPGHFRQQYSSDGNADDADRQLVEPVRIVQRRQRASGEERCDDGVREQRDLRSHRTECRRPERTEKPAHIFVEFQRCELRQNAVNLGVAGKQDVLQKT